MSESYRPSNGTEGEGFMSVWCMECERDKAFWDGSDGDGCEIAARSMAFNVGDPEYPTEWVRDEDGPKCLAFVALGKPVPTEKELEGMGQLSVLTAPGATDGS